MRKRRNWRELVSWRSLATGVVLAGVGTGAFFLGRSGLLGQASARGPAPAVAAQPAPEPMPSLPAGPAPSAAYTKGVVAYIYGTVPITREELGEYLIARFGFDRLETFVNKKIIEYHAQQQGVAVTAAEIDADLAETLKSLQVDARTFADKVLKARGKTLYEWREDVIRPKLLMNKLCQGRVHVEEDDLKKAFEAYYGEKVRVQLIMWPKEEHPIALKMWDSLRKDEKEFERVARQQRSPELARVGGKIDPFGRYTTGSPQLEKVAFEQLDVGEISPVISTEHGPVVIKLLEKIPPQGNVSLESVRPKLEKEIIEKKRQQEIPILFAELKKQADPKLLLKKYETQEELEGDVHRELNSTELRGVLDAQNQLGLPPEQLRTINGPPDPPPPAGGTTGGRKLPPRQ
jgi:hypothetical protein